MSTTFDALCYARIFSDDGSKAVNEERWRIIPVKSSNGFNYISNRTYCPSKNIGIAIDDLCNIYGEDMLKLYDSGDECQIYIWVKRGGRIEKLNAVEITARSMGFLSKIDASICFSADPGFPVAD